VSGVVKVVLGLAVVLVVGVGALLLLEDEGAVGPASGAVVLGDAGADAGRTELPEVADGDRAALTADHAEPAALGGEAGGPEQLPDAAAALEAAEPLALLTGRVVDEAGRPVAEAKVVFHGGGGLLLARRLAPGGEFPDRPQTATDDDGRFALEVELLPADDEDEDALPGLLGGGGHGQLALVHQAFRTGMHDCPRLVQATLDMGTLVLEPGARVSGRVVDENGRPIADAEVSGRNIAAQSGGLSGGIFSLIAGRAAETHGASISGPDGRFVVTGLGPGPAEISASAEGRQLGLVEDLELAPHQTHDVGDVVLGAGAAIAGWVLDDAGRPVLGARLRVSSMMRIMLNSMDDMPRRHMGQEFRMRAESDVEGRFELSGLSPGQYSVHVEAEGFSRLEQQNVSTGTDDLRLTLRPLGGLLISVADEASGEPLDGARLHATPGPSGSFMGMRGGDALPVLTGAAALAAAGAAAGNLRPEGLYLVQDVPPQGAEVELSADGFATLNLDATPVDPGGFGRAVALLLPESVLAGVVLDSDGEAVPDAKVSIAPWTAPESQGGFGGDEVVISRKLRRTLGGGSSAGNWRRVRSDDEGHFVMRGVPAGSWELSAKADGFSPSEALVTELAEGERREGLTLVTPVAGAIAGRVVERDGTPVAGAEVQVKILGEQGGADALIASAVLGFDPSGRNASTDGKGEFLVGGLLPGSYEVKLAMRQGLSMGNAMMIVMGGSETSNEPDGSVRVDVLPREQAWVELVRPPSATLSGQVLAGGRPVPDLTVSLSPAGSFLPFGGQRARTDRYGNYEFTGVEPGEFDLSAVAPGAASPVEHTLKLDGGQNATQDLVFSGATVTGRVTDADSGQGVGGVTINMIPVKSESSPGFSGTSSMAFSFVSVGPGGGSSGMQMDIGGGALSRVRTAPDGRFEVRWVQPGEYTLQAEGGGVVSTEHGPLDIKDRTLVDGVEIKAPRGAVLMGMLTSVETGMPLSGTPISLEAVGGGDREMTVAEEGRYRFEGLAAGEYSVQVMGSGFGGAPLASEIVNLAAGEERVLDLSAAGDSSGGGGQGMTISIGG